MKLRDLPQRPRYKFPDCADCIHHGNERVCEECDCGELFEERDSVDPLDFDDERSDE